MTTSSKGKKGGRDSLLTGLVAECQRWLTEGAAAETLTLDDLAGTLSAPSEEAVEAEVGRVPRARLEALGRRLETGAIVASLPAFVVSAGVSWQQLPEEARGVLVGFDPRVLAMLPTLGVGLRETLRRHNAQSSGFAAELERRRSLAAEAFSTGVRLRDQAVRAMRREVADGDEARAALESRKGVAETAEALADGLTGVASEVETRIGTGERAEAMGRKGLDAAYVARLRAAADEVRETDKAAAGTAAQEVTKAALDVADGRVLWLVDGVWRAFLDAQALDGRVRLPKLGRMADVFVGKGPKKADSGKGAPPEG